MSTPAGWYDDGQHPGQQRWWDGTQWTEQYQPAPGAAPVAPAPVEYAAQPAYAQQPGYAPQTGGPAPRKRLGKGAIVGIAVGAAVVLAGAGVGIAAAAGAFGGGTSSCTPAMVDFAAQSIAAGAGAVNTQVAIAPVSALPAQLQSFAVGGCVLSITGNAGAGSVHMVAAVTVVPVDPAAFGAAATSLGLAETYPGASTWTSTASTQGTYLQFQTADAATLQAMPTAKSLFFYGTFGL